MERMKRIFSGNSRRLIRGRSRERCAFADIRVEIHGPWLPFGKDHE